MQLLLPQVIFNLRGHGFQVWLLPRQKLEKDHGLRCLHRRGELIGLNPDGSLVLRDENGKSVTVRFGEVHLRPLA